MAGDETSARVRGMGQRAPLPTKTSRVLIVVREVTSAG
jgi:hypothetical protein